MPYPAFTKSLMRFGHTPRRRDLAAAASLSLALLAIVAGSTEAGWKPSNDNPPATSSEQVCRNGLVWRVAHTGLELTHVGTRTPALVPTLGVHAPDPNSPVGEPWLTSDESLALSHSPIYLNRQDFEDPTQAPADDNLFEFSGIHTFEFPRLTAPAAGADDNLQIQWAQDRDPAEPDDFTTARIADCYLIDLAPGVFPNTVNPRVSRGRVDVAIPTTRAFDARSIKRESVRLGTVTPSARPLEARMNDVDGDGDSDLVLQFRTSEAGIACGSTAVKLTARASQNRTISGTDSVVPVTCP